MSSDYGDQSYWDQRYAEANELFDWYQKYKTIKPTIEDLWKDKKHLMQVLHVGCGNSSFAEVANLRFNS